MPDHSPAETLIAAASLLREHVGFLQLLGVRGPWSVHTGPTGYPQEISNVGVPILVANTFTDPKAPPVMANYIALMHPGVGLALADWLESAARDAEQIGPDPFALTVAGQLLGGAS